MQLIIFSCLVAVALGFPQNPADLNANVITDRRDGPIEAQFDNELEVDNGIYMQSIGEPGSEGQANMRGSFRLPTADGGFETVEWVADELGYRATSVLIPVKK